MIIDLQNELKKYNISPKGIIHIGAHLAEESEIYEKIGFKNQIYIEANPAYFEQLKEKFKNNSHCIVLNELVYDVENEIKFNLANNGQSSSILELKLHKKYYPYIDYDGFLYIKSKRMDNIIKNNNLDINNFNGVSIDVQGVELNVLQSFGDLLKNIEFIETEINVEELYEKCSLLPEIDNYLKKYEFERVQKVMWDNGNVGWGDALYIKKKI